MSLVHSLVSFHGLYFPLSLCKFHRQPFPPSFEPLHPQLLGLDEISYFSIHHCESFIPCTL